MLWFYRCQSSTQALRKEKQERRNAYLQPSELCIASYLPKHRLPRLLHLGDDKGSRRYTRMRAAGSLWINTHARGKLLIRPLPSSRPSWSATFPRRFAPIRAPCALIVRLSWADCDNAGAVRLKAFREGEYNWPKRGR